MVTSLTLAIVTTRKGTQLGRWGQSPVHQTRHVATLSLCSGPVSWLSSSRAVITLLSSSLSSHMGTHSPCVHLPAPSTLSQLFVRSLQTTGRKRRLFVLNGTSPVAVQMVEKAFSQALLKQRLNGGWWWGGIYASSVKLKFHGSR